MAIHGPQMGTKERPDGHCFGSRHQHHDAREFLDWLIAILEDETNPHRDQPCYMLSANAAADKARLDAMALPELITQEVQRLQGCEDGRIAGRLKHLDMKSTKCGKCGYTSRVTSTASMIPIAVTQQDHSIPLENFLDRQYVFAEDLTGNEQYYCDKCRQKVDATQQLTLIHLPEYLIISLGRFQSDWQNGKEVTSKVRTLVTFPPLLDMHPYFSGELKTETKYECYAVQMHDGSLISGHWWALVRSLEREKHLGVNKSWIEMNDRMITDATWKDTQDARAALLWYRRVPSAGGTTG